MTLTLSAVNHVSGLIYLSSLIISLGPSATRHYVRFSTFVVFWISNRFDLSYFYCIAKMAVISLSRQGNLMLGGLPFNEPSPCNETLNKP